MVLLTVFLGNKEVNCIDIYIHIQDILCAGFFILVTCFILHLAITSLPPTLMEQ